MSFAFTTPSCYLLFALLCLPPTCWQGACEEQELRAALFPLFPHGFEKAAQEALHLLPWCKKMAEGFAGYQELEPYDIAWLLRIIAVYCIPQREVTPPISPGKDKS